MLLTRRHTLQWLVLAGAAVATRLTAALPLRSPADRAARPIARDQLKRYGEAKANRSLNLLVLGGGIFAGPAITQYALDRGHRVTLVNRGRSNPGLFPEARHLRVDRLAADGWAVLPEDEQWDAVIDTWSGEPEAVERSLRVLEGRYQRYLYISSIAVYGRDNYRNAPITETAPLPKTAAPSDATEEPYASRKLRCELLIARHAVDRAIILRPHQIYGRYIAPDGVAQFYWPARIDEGGEILAPGDGEDYTQYIDVADLGRFTVQAIEREQRGIFNTCRRIRWNEYLYGLRALTAQPSIHLNWASWDFLKSQQIRPFSQMPLWVPRQEGPGFNHIDASRAESVGLSYRPFAETMSEVFRAMREYLPADHQWGRDGDANLLSRSRERELLELLGKDTG